MKRKLAVFLTACLLISFSLSNSDSFAAGGSWKADSNGWWYEYSDGSYAMGWIEIDDYWYYFLGSGYMDYSEYRDGCWLNADGTWNTAYSGGHWASDSKGWWYTDNSGWYPVSTWLWIDGSCYYFKASGYMAVDETIDGYYVDASGVRVDSTQTTEATEDHGERKEGNTYYGHYVYRFNGIDFPSPSAVDDYAFENGFDGYSYETIWVWDSKFLRKPIEIWAFYYGKNF